MKQIDSKYVVAGAILIFTVGMLFVYQRAGTDKEARALLNEQLREQKTHLLQSAKVVHTNADDATIATYVRDCKTPLRAEFDSYLDRLTQLSDAELERTDVLFEACASYFANKKQAAVVRLESDFVHYQELVVLASLYDFNAEKDYEVQDWQLFIAFQKQLASLLKDQVPIQKDIIALLENGLAPNDPAIRSKTEEAQEITQSATVITRQVDAIYNRLK